MDRLILLPTIGMVGLLENVDHKMTLYFKEEGDVLYLLGHSQNDLRSSKYLHNVIGIKFSPASYFELEEEICFQQKLKEVSAKNRSFCT